MKTTLTPKRVRDLFMDCLFKPEEIGPDGQPTKEVLTVEGITMTVGFCKERVKEHAAEIAALCEELPAEFKEGWSFLQMCTDKHGRQWGEHQNMQELFILGCASGKMKLVISRDMWSVLPGGMPYLLVLPEKGKKNEKLS